MILNEGALRELIRDAVREVLREERVFAPREEFIKVADAARLAAVTPATIRDWMGRGKLKRYHAGRELRVDCAELKRMLAAVTPAAPGGPIDPRVVVEQILARRANSKGPPTPLGTPEEEARRFVERHHGAGPRHPAGGGGRKKEGRP